MPDAPAPIAFPDGFVWGTATSAHQIEGGNVNSDWWGFEHDPANGCAESSGDACDSWHRWPEDVALVAAMGLSAYRFSIEWCRIEPAEGEFSLAALDHYRRQCAALRGRGIEPVVTFHHFTIPRWLAARGGWEAPDVADAFGRYVERASAHLGDLVGRACTLNEPNVLGVMGYTVGTFPPGVHDDLERHLAVNANAVAAHRRAAEVLRAGPGDFPVGLTLSMAEFQAVGGGDAEVVVQAAEDILERPFLEAAREDDYVGVQAYTRTRMGPLGQLDPEPGVPLTQMGYEVWPHAVEHCVRRAAAVSGVPVLVTESGIATEDDAERIAYLSAALAGVARCLDDGLDVRGYFVWSLLDNFEWNDGFRPLLGLHAVDRRTFERRPKPSAQWFAAVAAANALVPAPPS